MSFDLGKCVLRLAEPRDREDLIRVAKGIWGGSDYLPKVLDRWIAEPWFLVCEYEGRAIACLKMTLFPDNVLWFEGLRVQNRYQNKGIATLMNKRIFAIAQKLRQGQPSLSYEFCTYYLNKESLHLTRKLGFQEAEKFYNLDKRGVQNCLNPKLLKDIDLKRFHNYPVHIPCAWQAVHNSPASLPFLREHGELFQTPHATYYLGGLHERCILLLERPQASLKQDLPYFQYFFGSRKKYSIILPTSFRKDLPLLHKCGFRSWEKERVPNMLVLKM